MAPPPFGSSAQRWCQLVVERHREATVVKIGNGAFKQYPLARWPHWSAQHARSMRLRKTS